MNRLTDEEFLKEVKRIGFSTQEMLVGASLYRQLAMQAELLTTGYFIARTQIHEQQELEAYCFRQLLSSTISNEALVEAGRSIFEESAPALTVHAELMMHASEWIIPEE